MLEINGQRVSAKELIQKFEKHPNGSGITKIYERLKTNPVFLINSAVKRVLENGKEEFTNPRRKQDSKGYDVQMRFTFWDNFADNANDPKQVEVRYYKTKTPRNTGGNIIMVYSPKAIDLFGAFHRVENDEELAVFMLLAPACETSPLFNKDRIASIYQYEDKVKNAEKKIEKYDVYTKIVRLLESIEDSDLPFISRGLGIPGVKDMTAVEVKAAVTAYAFENKEKFLEKYNSNVILEFEGRVLFGLETGLFKTTQIGGTTNFFWGPKSSNKEELIFQSDNGSQNATTDFINHIKLNREQFLPHIMSSSNKMLADEGLEEFLKLQKEPNAAKELFQNKQEVVSLSSVVDFASAKQYIINKHPEGKQASPANTSKLLQAVESGGLTEDTVNDYLIAEIFPKEK